MKNRSIYFYIDTANFRESSLQTIHHAFLYVLLNTYTHTHTHKQRLTLNNQQKTSPLYVCVCMCMILEG